jgi:hypothetical protein
MPFLYVKIQHLICEVEDIINMCADYIHIFTTQCIILRNVMGL